MKRIGILSDTHSCWDDRYAIHFKECDEIWHAGDIGDISVLQRLQDVVPTVRAVRGNIDHGIVSRQCPETLLFDIERIKVFMTHIGGYPGRYAPGVCQYLARPDVKLMIAGHSHILKVIYDDRFDILHVNPGAAGYHGWHKVRTLVRLSIDGTAIRDLEVIELGKIKI